MGEVAVRGVIARTGLTVTRLVRELALAAGLPAELSVTL
jgi:hypothetical protein